MKLRNLLLVAAVAACAFGVKADYIWMVGNGTLGGWDAAKCATLVSEPGESTVFKGIVYLNANEDFKFMTAPDWGNTEYGAKEGAVMTNGTIELASGKNDTGYSKLQVAESANYIVTINTAANTASFVKAGYQETQIAQGVIGLVGDATPNGWSLDNLTPLYQNLEKPYIYAANNVKMTAGDFKVNLVPTRRWDAFCFGTMDPTDPTKMIVGGDDNKWQITKVGEYNFTVNTLDNTINFEEYKVETSVVGIVTEDIDVEYYTLTGVRVENPAKGIYIRKAGGKAVKVAL